MSATDTLNKAWQGLPVASWPSQLSGFSSAQRPTPRLSCDIPRLLVVATLNTGCEPCGKSPIQPDSVQILYHVKEKILNKKKKKSHQATKPFTWVAVMNQINHQFLMTTQEKTRMKRSLTRLICY
jgi:hypothetical protein